ncbi:hypothetical protein IEQ34_011345 [Dendrobium chrysotoxum]|uniref:Uncharacterized protein n=1 Tax=Dendrobium chrysotoxum TaxID=161865 RepID=A0AAV7GYN4_DENCH|nr:hypothetical protein IEQ34_011345 [Dendrobium chrysotoxum]
MLDLGDKVVPRVGLKGLGREERREMRAFNEMECRGMWKWWKKTNNKVLLLYLSVEAASNLIHITELILQSLLSKAREDNGNLKILRIGKFF